MCLDCGRKPEYPGGTHGCTVRTCKLHAERGWDLKPGCFLLQGNSATNRATVQSRPIEYHTLKHMTFQLLLTAHSKAALNRRVFSLDLSAVVWRFFPDKRSMETESGFLMCGSSWKTCYIGSWSSTY